MTMPHYRLITRTFPGEIARELTLDATIDLFLTSSEILCQDWRTSGVSGILIEHLPFPGSSEDVTVSSPAVSDGLDKKKTFNWTRGNTVLLIAAYRDYEYHFTNPNYKEKVVWKLFCSPSQISTRQKKSF